MPIATFEDPGPRRGAPSLTLALAALRELMDRPGQWAKIASYRSPASAQSFKARLQAKVEDIPIGRFEITTRTCVDGSADVFAIFLPEEEL